MKSIAFGLLGLVASAGFAFAADPVVFVPPVAPPVGHFSHQNAPYDWSGLYLGGYVGHVSGHLTGDETGPALSGIDGGIQAHYNFMLDGGLVVSPFVIVPVPGALRDTLTDYDVDLKVNWALIGGVRLGYAHGRWLPYAFVGAEAANVSATGPTLSDQNTHTGLVAGAGFEYAVDDNWTIGARYAFISMGAREYDDLFAGAIGWQGHSIAATLNFRFR